MSAPSSSFPRQRVQNTDFPRNEILVRDGKGAQDWITTLPESRHVPLQAELKMAKTIFKQDLEDGDVIRTVQELLGHCDVKTTIIYTHVRSRGPGSVRSPLDGL